MADALRTGRKTIPIHPVRVRHVAPILTELREAQRARYYKPTKPDRPDQLALAFAELRRAAYDGRPTVPELEARIDRLLK